MYADFKTFRDIEAGNWGLTGNQLIFYGTDGVTPIATFNVFD
jgi:hypothetical protein